MPSLRHGLVVSALFAVLAVPRASLAYPVFSPEQELAAPSNYLSGSMEDHPSVATNGTDFLVAWSEYYGGAIECARVAAGPVLLDRPSLQLSLNGTAPQAFWDGTKYLVVAAGQAQRIDASSGAVDPAFTLQGAPASGRAAFGGGELLDVWQAADGSLQGGIFDLTGAETSASITLPSGAVSDWGVAASPGQFLVGWITPAGMVAAARVSTSGVVADATPLVIAGGGDAGAPAAASINVAGAPGQYLVSWVSGTFPYAHDYSARVATTGAVADPGGVYMSGPFGYLGTPPVAAWDGTEWWVVDTESDTYSVAATLGTTGAPTAPVQYDGYPVAAIAATPTARLAASSFDLSIGAASVTTTGAGSIIVTPENSLGISVSTHPAPQSPVCTVASPSGYLVTWSEAQVVYGLRFQGDGTAIDQAPFALGVVGSTPGQACGVLGSTYYFGATEVQGGFTFQGDLESFPTTGTLTIAKNVVPIVPDAGTAANAYPQSMACMADRCLLVSADGQTLWATIFGAGGNVILAPFSVSWWPFSTPELVVAATDGSSFLVLQRPSNEPATIVVLQPDGAQSSPFVPEDTLSPYSVAGGAGVFLAAGAPGLLWFDDAANALGSPQPVPAQGSIAMAWEGAGFFVAQGGVGMEVPATPPAADAGAAPLTPQPLFPSSSSGATFVASNGAGEVLAITTEPRGGFATPVVIARFGAPGPAAPDGGAFEGGSSDGGSPDGEGDDGGSLDSGVSADASLDGTVPVDLDAAMFDAGPSYDAADGGGSADGGGAEDAALAGDGGPPSATAQSGCGCTTAGGGLGYSGGWLAIAALGLLRARRSRARQRG